MRLLIPLVALAGPLVVACSGLTLDTDPDAGLSDGSQSDRPSDGREGRDAELGEGGRTCADVGKGYGIESCCDGGYCIGQCLVNTVPSGCFCMDKHGYPTHCADPAVCCPDLGCSSVLTCDAFHADGGK